MAAKQDLVIIQGDTFSRILRWESPPVVYKPITAITKAAPAVITCSAHGAPNGWRVAVVSVQGMTQINARSTPPSDSDYHKAVVSDANTITLNDVNAAEFSAYKSGGYLQYNTPVNMTGYEARMSIKDKVGGTELLALSTTNSRITINNTEKYIQLLVPANITAAITWSKGVYDLEMYLPGATEQVTKLLYGTVTVTTEVTTA